jgi:hypothetical protein
MRTATVKNKSGLQRGPLLRRASRKPLRIPKNYLRSEDLRSLSLPALPWLAVPVCPLEGACFGSSLVDGFEPDLPPS